jgi:hypothetical protein
MHSNIYVYTVQLPRSQSNRIQITQRFQIPARPEADEWVATSTFRRLDIPGRASGSTKI